MEIVQRLNSEGRTIIPASHDPLVHQADAVSAIVRMQDGRIEEEAA
jgi:ABC-type lipoprotein export system ATPase subunit